MLTRRYILKARFNLPQNNLKATFYSGGQSGTATYATKYELLLEKNNRIDADALLSVRIGEVNTLIIEKSTEFEQDISNINATLSTFGDIVTYSVEDFATANQGQLADTALQPNDNISELTNNVYLKSETYTKQEVNQLIQAIPQFTVVIVQTLPQTGQKLTLYLVPKEGDILDVYNEYIWITASNSFELIGTTKVNLDGYATEDWVLNQRYLTGITRSDVITALGYTPYNASNPSNYITLSDLNGYATETWVNNQGFLISSDLANYVTNSSLATTLADYVTRTNLTTILANYALTSQIPTVGNGTVTINQGDIQKGTFTLNQSGDVIINLDAGGETPTNMVTTDTVQDITAKKTFIGDKAINFKQSTTADKLGFTLFSNTNSELAAFEFRPSTIGSSALFNLNLQKTSANYVGFRYHGTNAINVACPKVATAGNYYIPINFTNGTNTVTATNVGTVNISTLIPTIATSVNSSSTNTQTVGAKLFYDTVGNIETLLASI